MKSDDREPLLVSPEERDLILEWRDQQKDDRRVRIQYEPSLDRQAGDSSSRATLGDFQPEPPVVPCDENLEDAAERLGVELVWLSPRARAAREREKRRKNQRRTRVVDGELECVIHGTEDMRPYTRKGKKYLRCRKCANQAQEPFNGEYRRKMKDKDRKCPRCPFVGRFSGPMCRPCHARYERERRGRRR